MLFYSPQFLLFSVILLGVLATLHRDRPRKVVLLIASYVFYMAWNPVFILLIIGSTAVDYLVGGRLSREDDPGRRKGLLAVSLTANLGLLGFFKYTGMLEESAAMLLRAFGAQVHWTTLEIVLPVGISFYTFQTLSYSIDVYRRRISATRSPLDFALFVAFFPQLLAGPIVRAADFLPQLARPSRLRCTQEDFFLILRGLAKKVIIADNVGHFADVVFSQPGHWPSAVIWLATISFAVQIYCDFSGYSDMAIGIARVLGFELPRNFEHPYFARNPSEFWRRWHISLSSWLRDYLYIPLGGNRGSSLQIYRNLMLTMLLGGLWHGASWNFVLWGLLHGIALIGHRWLRAWRATRTGDVESSLVVRIVCMIALQYWVLLTWIAFRVRDFDAMYTAVWKFVVFDFDFGFSGIGLGNLPIVSTTALLAGFLVLHVLSKRTGGLERRMGLLSLPAA
ncbi:MAG: MBOAT family protein, partial [bacterium]|nr:MBOAT family protein [bacterium]